MGNNLTNCKVLVVGLDGSGKTTIVKLAESEFKPPGDIDDVKPTVSHEIHNFRPKDKKEVQFSAWDLSGKESYRELWKMYFKDTDAIVFVIDCSEDEERTEEAKDCLFEVLQTQELKDSILLICANKQDKPSSKTAGEIKSLFGLDNSTPALKDRRWKIQSTCAKTGEGLKEGFLWLANETRQKGSKKKK